jgi:hypothetical protein
MTINIQGYEVLIDDEDFERIKKFSWHRTSGNRPPIYFCRTKRYGGVRKTIMLHKFIMNAPENMEVDHRDLNTLDNRKSNLRICTHAENCKNRRGVHNSTGYKGVIKYGLKWRARITKNRKTILVGDFGTPEAAYAAYCKASIKYHGEFGRIE